MNQLVSVLNGAGSDIAAEYLHADQRERFSLEPVLENLARSSDVATARFATRHMEYRSEDVKLAGSTVGANVVWVPLLLAALGACLSYGTISLLEAKKNQRRAAKRRPFSPIRI